MKACARAAAPGRAPARLMLPVQSMPLVLPGPPVPPVQSMPLVPPMLRALLTLPVLLALLSCTPTATVATDPRVAAFAQLPDWRGIWVAEGFDTDISGYPGQGQSWNFLLAGRDAPWTAAVAAQLPSAMAQARAAEATRKSVSWGYPMMMEGTPPLQFLITPEETLVINFYRDVRHVYTDGRQHPKAEDRWPTPWGDSVGHWEGDTLVIDTVSVKRPGLLPMPPLLSEAAHYVERLRRSGPDRIESQLTIEDPATLAKPWVVKLAYKRTTTIDRLIHDVFDNDRTEVQGNGMTIAPPKQ